MNKTKLVVNGESYEIEIFNQTSSSISFKLDGRSYDVAYEKSIAANEPQRSRSNKQQSSQNQARSQQKRRQDEMHDIRAPIPGLLLELLVCKGDSVKEGQILLRLEAMKMQNNIFAPCAGKVIDVLAEQGQEITDNQVLLRLAKD